MTMRNTLLKEGKQRRELLLKGVLDTVSPAHVALERTRINEPFAAQFAVARHSIPPREYHEHHDNTFQRRETAAGPPFHRAINLRPCIVSVHPCIVDLHSFIVVVGVSHMALYIFWICKAFTTDLALVCLSRMNVFVMFALVAVPMESFAATIPCAWISVNGLLAAFGLSCGVRRACELGSYKVIRNCGDRTLIEERVYSTSCLRRRR